MPSDGAANLHKKRLVSKDYVLVVWSEDGLYDDTALESPYNDLKIIISPLASGLYNVRVIRSDRLAAATAAALTGPLQGTTVVCRCALGPLVRLTAMNAYRAIVASLIGPARPFALRQRILADIIRHYRSDPTLGALFTPLFFHRYTDAKISFSAATPLVAASAPVTSQQQQQQRPQQQPQRQPPPPPPPSQRYQQLQQYYHKHQVSAQASIPSPSRPAPKVPPPSTPPPTRMTPIAGQRVVPQTRPAPPPPPQPTAGMARGPGTLYQQQQSQQATVPSQQQHVGFIPGHRPAPPPPGTQRWVPFDRRKKQQQP